MTGGNEADRIAEALPGSPPGPEQPAAGGVSMTVLWVAVHAFLWVGLGVAMVALVPRFERTFRDFALKVSALTGWTLAVSHWMASYWYVAALVLPPTLAADAAVISLLRRNRAARWLGALRVALLILLPLGLLLAGVLGLSLTLLELIEGLSR